jgi:hypothetical protein
MSLDPLRSITGSPDWCKPGDYKENNRKGGYRAECGENEMRVLDVVFVCGVSQQSIRGFAKRSGMEINKGILCKSDASVIIAHYANC